MSAAGRREQTAEVVVIGAGPVGLLAALWLSERGIDVRIVDKYQRAALHSYGLALHPGSLLLLDELGLAASLIERGHRVDRIALQRGARQVAEIDLARVGGRFPFVLVLSQSMLEGALERRLRDNGVEVLWGHSLLNFDADDDGVTSLIVSASEDPAHPTATPQISTTRIRSSYLIGADGFDSLVRGRLGIRFPAVGGALAYALMELQATIEQPERMRLVLGDGTTDVFWPLGRGRGRFSLQVPLDAEPPDPKMLELCIRDRAPWFESGIDSVDWVTSVRFEPRLAERFGRGRVWLAGDAAHVTSPIGVQSMNVGLREVRDLARRMTSVLRDRGSPRLLEYYGDERRREWKMLLGIQDRLRILDGAPAWADKLAGKLVISLPASGRDLNRLLEQVGLRLHWLRRRDRKPPGRPPE